MTVTPLTPRQSNVLGMIRQHIQVFGYPPTRAEICDACGFKSPNAALEHLKALDRKGAIKLTPHISRGIQIKAAP